MSLMSLGSLFAGLPHDARTTGVANGTGPGPLTIERIEESMRQVEHLTRGSFAGQGLGGAGLQLGVEVIANPLCIAVERVRVHRRRRGQSLAYHRRVDKKWLKRFGTREVPRAYLINRAAIGRPGQMLVMHPSMVKEFKESLCERAEVAAHEAAPDDAFSRPAREDLHWPIGFNPFIRPAQILNFSGC